MVERRIVGLLLSGRFVAGWWGVDWCFGVSNDADRGRGRGYGCASVVATNWYGGADVFIVRDGGGGSTSTAAAAATARTAWCDDEGVTGAFPLGGLLFDILL